MSKSKRQSKGRRKKKKVYAVHKGHVPGVYMTWDECKEQVTGFPGAKFKSFASISHAREFAQHGKVEPRTSKTHREADHAVDQHESALFAQPLVKPNQDHEPLVVYTDGSTTTLQDGKLAGGYGVWFDRDDPRNFHGRFPLPSPTNNRCELFAIIRAIETIDEREYARIDQEIVVCSDSKYSIRCVTQWWKSWQRTNFKNNTVKNRGLIERLRSLIETRPVSFFYSPGHAGDPGNEGADELAGKYKMG